MKVESESEVVQSCPTLCDPMDCSLPGSSIHGIFRQEYWSFSFSIIPSKEIPVLISFRMDWLDLLAVQGTLKSLLHPDTRGPSSWSLGPANPSYSAPMLPPAREDVGDFSILGGYTSPHAVDVVL